MSKFLETLNYPDFLTVYNPFFIKNMSKAIEKTVKAINGREKIVIYGACNTDAICGVSLLFLLFKYLNADVEYYIPDDVTSNLNSDVIKNHINFLGAKLIVTVGCTVESPIQIELCKNMGMDILILDNSPIQFNVSSVTVNPLQKGCLYKFKEFSSTGLAYKLAQALSMNYDMRCVNKYIDLVLLGTLASGKPLIGENKIFIDEGIRYIRKSNNYGIKALFKVHKVKHPEINDVCNIVQTIKPTVNALGRMDNAKIAVELFTTSDGYRAEQIAKYLSKEVKNTYNESFLYK